MSPEQCYQLVRAIGGLREAVWAVGLIIGIQIFAILMALWAKRK